jgi:hypothetical protein
MVDAVTRMPVSHIRNIEDIFGDMNSIILARKFPKWTCFHIFIEEIIKSVIYEDLEEYEKKPGEYWVDYLLKSNCMESFEAPTSVACKTDAYEYLELLQKNDLVNPLCEKIAKQVFHILFSNRSTMLAFGKMVAGYVLETASDFEPDAFNVKSGHLLRASIPTWAKNAVFHRDKGRCVICQADLTKLFSQKAAIHYDHIIPLALGGMNCITNLQLTCSSCNLQKGAKSRNTSFHYESWYDY